MRPSRILERLTTRRRPRESLAQSVVNDRRRPICDLNRQLRRRQRGLAWPPAVQPCAWIAFVSLPCISGMTDCIHCCVPTI